MGGRRESGGLAQCAATRGSVVQSELVLSLSPLPSFGESVFWPVPKIVVILWHISDVVES